MTRKQVYDAAKKYGHSPQAALEIAIDYERGLDHAMKWVKAITQRNG